MKLKVAILTAVGMLGMASAANATGSISNSDGFTPTTVIDFEQAASGANITSYYAAQGVTFSTLYQDYAYSGSFPPDLSGGVGANFPTSNPAGNAVNFTINFSSPVSNAAFAIVTDNAATFTTFLGATQVDSVSYVGGYVPGADIVSFTNSNFDTIQFSGSGDNAVIIDNLGFNAGTAAVPEPTTWALMLLGFGMVGYAMRKRPIVRTNVNYA